MSLFMCSLGSSSSGNCTYIASESVALLVDLGISTSRIEQGLKLFRKTPSSLGGILITHTHSDHISHLANFIKKYNLPIYTHFLSTSHLITKYPQLAGNIREFVDNDFFIQDIIVSPFRVPHDIACVGYTISSRRRSVSIATDLGHISSKVMSYILDSSAVLLESNHDIQMLQDNIKYNEWLKKRILSPKGHLSNGVTASTSVALARSGVQNIMLAHLSQENNTPEIAYNTTAEILSSSGYSIGKNIQLSVAPRDRLSDIICIDE